MAASRCYYHFYKVSVNSDNKRSSVQQLRASNGPTWCLTLNMINLAHFIPYEYYTKKYSIVKNEREGEGEGRPAWKLIGHWTGAVDSGAHRAKR